MTCITRSYANPAKKCDLILASFNNFIVILRHDDKRIKVMHQFGASHSNPIVDFWLSKKSIFSISSGAGELGSICVPTNLVEHVSKMKVAQIPEHQRDQEDSEPEPES